MRIGTISYKTNTGLGYQCRDYVKFLNAKPMVIDLSMHNRVVLNDWYPGIKVIKDYPRDEDIKEFIKDLDVLIFGETPLNYNFYKIAKTCGIKTATVINWEFFDHIIHPDYPLPDLFIMPSIWGYKEVKEFSDQKGIKCIQLHHPVDRNEITYKLRTTKKFLHIAGKPATYDRNGTWEFLTHVLNGRVTTQSVDLANQIRSRYRHTQVYTNIQDNNYLYQLGDILIYPRRYGGNSLVLNEALSSGMPVCMPDISPNNNILPTEWLVPAKIVESFTPRTKIDVYSVISELFKEKLDWFRNCDIEKESRKANEIADTISWDKLKSKYIEALEDLCKS